METEFPEIRFCEGNPKLDDYDKYNWNENEERKVEFYPGKLTKVTVIDASNPNLYDILMSLDDGKYVSADFEWTTNCGSKNIIDLFQYSSSKGVIIVTGNMKCGAEAIKKFHSNVKIFGKGMSCDKKKLKAFLVETENMEDIEKTRLKPNKITESFEKLTNIFIGNSCSKFKDHRIQMSNWSARPLTIKQILYSAHDAYSMLLVYDEITSIYGKIDQKSQDDDFKPIERKLFDEEPFIFNNQKAMNYSQQLSLKQLYFIGMRKNKNNDINDNSFLNSENEQLLKLVFPNKGRKAKITKLQELCAFFDIFLKGNVIKRKNHFICCLCGNELQYFESAFAHCLSKHIQKPIQNSVAIDFKQMALSYFVVTSMVECPVTKINPNLQLENKQYCKTDRCYCKLCDKQFENVDELKNHCWLNHSDELNEIFGLKVQPGLFDPQGLFIINDLQLAKITEENNIQCKMCSQIFEDPTTFFFHTFIKHTYFKLLSSKDTSKSILKYKNLPNVPKLIKTSLKNQLKTYESKIFNNLTHTCIECNCSFKDNDSLYEHLLEKHTVFCPK